ncbi:MAG: hypothetical protein ACTSRS_19195 [Candidatus Helarchaeota archaeon]
MVREKVGIIQRVLAAIGKRLLWWRAEKMDLYVLALMARETVKKYQELSDGSLEKGAELLKRQFAESAKTYLRNFMDQMKMIVSRDLEDMEFMSAVSLWSILGKNYHEFYTPAKYIRKDDPINPYGVPYFLNVCSKCLMCSILDPSERDLYKDLDYGEIITYALGSLIELILEYVGYNFRVEVKETRCFLRGDPYGEIVYLLYEKE